MNETRAQRWGRKLREHLAEEQAEKPVPARADLTAEDELKCQVEGGFLLRWLRDWGPEMIRTRMAQLRKEAARTRGEVAEPVVVVVADDPGLVAVREMIGTMKDELVFGRRSELERYEAFAPDTMFDLHCEVGSYFEEVTGEEAEVLRRRHRLGANGESLWCHCYSAIAGPHLGHGGRIAFSFADGGIRRLEALDEWTA